MSQSDAISAVLRPAVLTAQREHESHLADVIIVAAHRVHDEGVQVLDVVSDLLAGVVADGTVLAGRRVPAAQLLQLLLANVALLAADRLGKIVTPVVPVTLQLENLRHLWRKKWPVLITPTRAKEESCQIK